MLKNMEKALVQASTIIVDWEIIVKKFSWVAPPMKINFFLQQTIMYTVCFDACAFCMQLPLDP